MVRPADTPWGSASIGAWQVAAAAATHPGQPGGYAREDNEIILDVQAAYANGAVVPGKAMTAIAPYTA
jgi:hypothetical protein